MRKLIIIAFTVFVALSASAQKQLYQMLAKSIADTHRVNVVVELGDYYQPSSNHSAANQE